MGEILCKNCGKLNPRKINKDGSISNYTRIYCCSNCKDIDYQRNNRKKKPPYNKEARRKEWEVLKSKPQKLEQKRKVDSESKRKIREWLANYKIEKGCIDCGYNQYSCALQLDHEGFKSTSISDARTSIDRLKKEIEEGECVVRCANCHSVITWKRKIGLL